MNPIRSFGFILTVLALLLIVQTPASAWRILSANNIPEGAVALTDGPGGLWCGYQTAGDSILRVLDPEDGSTISEITPPESRCYGLSFHNGNVWFLGRETLYSLGQEGRVESQMERPFEVMHGLAYTDDGFWSVVFDSGTYFLSLYDIEAGEVHRFETTLRNPAGLAWDGQFLWVTDRIDGFLHQFNPATEEEVDIQPTPVAGPTGIEVIDGNLLLVDDGQNEENDLLYTIDPSGEEAPKILPISRRLDFGWVQNLDPRTINFAIFNVGTVDLTVESVVLANGQNGYELSGVQNNVVVAPGRHTEVSIRLDPNGYRWYEDTLIITSDDPVEPVVRSELLGLGIFGTRKIGIYPDTLNFGVVRADPWRDGSRMETLCIYNMGRDFLRLDAIEYRIREIFGFDPPEFPSRLETAETLRVEFAFTPHRGIQYLDTLLIYSNENRRIVRLPMRGSGSELVYNAGEVMWYHQLEAGEGAVGSIVRQPDINNDFEDDVVAVGPQGNVYCLHGFASDEADVLWTQTFANQPFSPVDLMPSGTVHSAGDLNGDGYSDVVIGSGLRDHAVYGLSGRNGDMLWRWNARLSGIEGGVHKIINGRDLNGDGASDPVVFIVPPEEGDGRLVRLDGATGRPVWNVNVHQISTVELLDDFDLDGIIDFVASGSNGNLYLYSGVNGGLINVIDVASSGTLLSVQDLNGDGWRDLMLCLENGNIAAWSVYGEEELWHVNGMNGVELADSHKFLIDAGYDLNEDGINEIVGCDEFDLVYVANPVDGQAYWAETFDDVTIMTVLADNDEDGIPEVITGHANGNINCLSGSDGSALWSFEMADVGSVVHLMPFENVDLGGFSDLVALFADGYVRCISSGGDLSVSDPYTARNPSTPILNGLYPNPFNGAVSIDFNLEKSSMIMLSVWDMNGREIVSRDLGFLNTGFHMIPFRSFEIDKMSSGTYLFRIDSDFGHSIGKGVLLK